MLQNNAKLNWLTFNLTRNARVYASHSGSNFVEYKFNTKDLSPKFKNTELQIISSSHTPMVSINIKYNGEEFIFGSKLGFDEAMKKLKASKFSKIADYIQEYIDAGERR